VERALDSTEGTLVFERNATACWSDELELLVFCHHDKVQKNTLAMAILLLLFNQ
jgi:hypothetical protein